MIGIKEKFSLKWVLISMVIYLVLEIVLAGVLGDMLRGTFRSHFLYMQLNVFLLLGSFFLGGLIVGAISPGIRIVEPALGAFLSIVITFLYSFFTPSVFYRFSLTKLLIGGVIAFGVALIGANMGEKIGAKFGNKKSQDYFNM